MFIKATMAGRSRYIGTNGIANQPALVIRGFLAIIHVTCAYYCRTSGIVQMYMKGNLQDSWNRKTYVMYAF